MKTDIQAATTIRIRIRHFREIEKQAFKRQIPTATRLTEILDEYFSNLEK